MFIKVYNKLSPEEKEEITRIIAEKLPKSETVPKTETAPSNSYELFNRLKRELKSELIKGRNGGFETLKKNPYVMTNMS